jgi:hypothetical protein
MEEGGPYQSPLDDRLDRMAAFVVSVAYLAGGEVKGA